MSPPTPQTLNAAKHIPKAALAGDLNPIFEAVRHGGIVVVKDEGGPRGAIVDLVDLRTLRDMAAYYAGPPALDLEDGAPPNHPPGPAGSGPGWPGPVQGSEHSQPVATGTRRRLRRPGAYSQAPGMPSLERLESLAVAAEAPKVMKTVKLCPREARVR